MPAPPVSRLILLLSGSGLSLRVPGRLPYPVSLGAYTGDVIQLVSLHTNRQPSVSCQFLCNAYVSPLFTSLTPPIIVRVTRIVKIFYTYYTYYFTERKQLFQLLSYLLFAFLRHLIRYALYFHICLFIASLLPFCDLAGTHDR